MAAALVISTVLNVALLALAATYLIRRHKRRSAVPDYAKLAAERFPPIVEGQVVFAGDSHVANAPLAEILCGVSQRGIGGQRIADVAGWVHTLAGARRIVLEVGVNDWYYDRVSNAELVERYGRLLDKVPVGADVVVLALPPTALRDVAPANDVLAKLASERGVRFELLPELGGCSLDGTHLNHDGYMRLSPLLRDVLT